MKKYKKIIAMFSLFACVSTTSISQGFATEIADTIVDETEFVDETEEETKKVETPIKANGYYAIQNLSDYVNDLSFEIDVKKDITRIEVIYSTNAPKITFTDNAGTAYETMNKTYNEMSLMQKEKIEIYKDGTTIYYMDVYYINEPEHDGTWTLNVMNVNNINDIVVVETEAPYGWEISNTESISKINGGVWYYLKDAAVLPNLIEPAISESDDNDDKKNIEEFNAEKENPYGLYGIIAICITIILLFVGKFLAQKKKEHEKIAIEKANLEARIKKKEDRKRIAKEQEEKFKKELLESDDWSDIEVDWDTTPKIKEVKISKTYENNIKNQKIEQMKRNNAIYIEKTKNKEFEDSMNQDEKLVSKQPTQKIPNIPNIPNNNEGFF